MRIATRITVWLCCTYGTWALGLRSGASLVPAEIETKPATMMDFVTSTGSSRIEDLALENVKYLRNKINKMEHIVVEDTNTNKLTRGLVVSLLMLLVVAVAATMSVRPSASADKEGRRCPLEIVFPSLSLATIGEQKVDKKPQLDFDAPIDWDSLVLTSDKFKCVLDPNSVTIERLLSTPPPTFIRKDGVSEAASVIRTPKYVTVSE